jgi:hypothetical protein
MTVEVADLLERASEFMRMAQIATSHRKRVNARRAAEKCVLMAQELVSSKTGARKVA